MLSPGSLHSCCLHQIAGVPSRSTLPNTAVSMDVSMAVSDRRSLSTFIDELLMYISSFLAFS